MSRLQSKGVRPYKTGSNAGFESNYERKEREAKERQKSGKLTEEELAKKNAVTSQFKGFVGGKQFRTKLGFQGNAFDTLWGKHIFLSFSNDDTELFDVAMQSELADVTERVVGGHMGSAYFIGDIGFFASNQFDSQGDMIREHEMKLTKGIYFLSDREWVTVNTNIKKIADYSESRAPRAIRGDSFGALALRANAFNVAKRMLECGLDPMIVNEENEDLFSILEEQYNRMTGVMHEILIEKDVSTHRILVPSEQKTLDDKEEACIQIFKNMLTFLTEFNYSLGKRIEQIKEDIKLKRRMELRREVVPDSVIYNIACENQANINYEKGTKLQDILQERILVALKHQAEHETLADLMQKQHAVVVRKNMVKKPMWTYKDDVVPSIEDADANADTKHIANEKVGGGNDVKFGGGKNGKDRAALRAIAIAESKKTQDKIAAAKELEDEMKIKEGETLLQLQERLKISEAKRTQLIKDNLRRANGLQTDDEIEAEKQAALEEEMEKKLMALSLSEEEEREAQKIAQARLEKETLAPLQGVLYKTDFEQTSYR